MLQKIKENRLISSKRLLNQLKLSAEEVIWFLSDTWENLIQIQNIKKQNNRILCRNTLDVSKITHTKSLAIVGILEIFRNEVYVPNIPISIPISF